MIFFLPVSLSILFIFLLLLIVFFFFFIQIEIVRIALGKLGIPPAVAFLILICSLIGSGINIPLYVKEAHALVPPGQITAFLKPWNMPSMADRHVIAINVGGALIPLLLCVYLARKAPFLPTLFATLISIIFCYKLARVVPGLGVTLPALIPPVVAVLLAFLFSPKNKIPVAYIAGVLGVLIGADILNLPNLGNYPGIMSIGGAGVYDGIFLVGIISALLA